ncbi:unnamed protein product [Citrullus colocynthis]|uniref:Rhodanese domain-containing protein n=1 Tax=Citrullus colocynthis TaxID=252529 RepID=A0ABP0YJU0_9ROSI
MRGIRIFPSIQTQQSAHPATQNLLLFPPPSFRKLFSGSLWFFRPQNPLTISSWPPSTVPMPESSPSTLERAKKLLDSGYPLLDVRTVEEFRRGHVKTEKIVNIPYLFSFEHGREKNDRFLEEVSAVFNTDDRFLVVCAIGIRSLEATQELQDNGFNKVKDQGGGFEAWVKNGFPVAKPKA